MRKLALYVLLVAFSVSVSGCDFGRNRELTAQLQKTQAEVQALVQENRKLMEELEANKKHIEELETEVAVVNKLKSLSGDAKKKLTGLLGKYSEGITDGLNVAKELGLPELKDVPVESLIKNLIGDEKNGKESNE